MDMIKEFQKYPKAWEAFLAWAEKYTILDWSDNVALSALSERYLLADLQAWLRSAGTHVTVENEFGGDPIAIYFPFVFDANTGENYNWYTHDNTFETAFYEGISKGLELRNNTLKLKTKLALPLWI